MAKKRGGLPPIAIVGMAFRFPGDLSDEESFWKALKAGRDLVSQIGPDRWATSHLEHPKRSEPGRSITFSAGVLSRIDEFDAQFFGISPREAAWLDPQQRLLLELAWEAMENGGQKPARLAGSDCAVYVGISGLDYGMRGLDDLASMTAHSMTGNTLSIAANRLSYVFDLRGPSMAVDTACSSSLVALHQACRCLEAGESSLALVGGMNMLLHPYPFVGFTKASMLSANGRCRAFDAAGDGYVRSEGGAVLLLKPLEQAEADGDPIHAVILASGVNADGSRKTGITIPSGEGQAELMRSVLRRTGLKPERIDYVEAHGTGTAVGDPIETGAIGSVYGQGRSKPLPIGSVKTNLGHLEPASGMAGLVKTVLMLKHRAAPPSLHLEAPNPNIDFSGLNLKVVDRFMPLKGRGRRPLVMGVNSFGFGGANAHVLLQSGPPDRNRASAPATLPPLFLSARTTDALRDMAARYASLLKTSGVAGYYDIAHTAACRRQFLEQRLAVPATDLAEMANQLEHFAAGENPRELLVEETMAAPGKVAFVYSGNGSQWAGMAQGLLRASPRFAAIIAELDEAMLEFAGFSVRDELLAAADQVRIDDTAVAQPLLFAIQVAVTRMLREQGIEPAGVAGHSVGEVAAAWASGALNLEQAIHVICARSSAQALTRGAGRMAAVGMAEQSMRELLAELEIADIEIAGINSPKNITIAGSLDALENLSGILAPRKAFFRLLDLDYAFHSQAMDGIRDRLADSLQGLAPGPAEIPFVSTVAGEVLAGRELGADYWWHNVRQPVRFMQAMQKLAELDCRIFIEIGPHAILQRYIGESLAAVKVSGRSVPTLRRNDDGPARIDEAALRVLLSQPEPALEQMFPVAGHYVELPSYAWQRERYWHPRSSEAYALIERERVHPLLGWRLKDQDAAWENALDPQSLPYLADHRVGGAIVMPGAAYVEMALAAAREWFGGEAFELEELDIVAPIVFDGEHARSLRFELQPREGSFQIRSHQRLSQDAWTLNAVGRLLGAPSHGAAPAFVEVAGSPVDRETHYRLARQLELDYGPAFQTFVAASVDGTVLTGRLEVSRSDDSYLLHPALLDACFQSLVNFFREQIDAGAGLPLLPVKVGRLKFWSAGPATSFRVSLIRRSARSVLAEFTLADDEGQVVAVLEDCRFRAASISSQARPEPARWQVVAKPLPHPVDPQPAIEPSNRDLVRGALESLAGWEGSLHRHDYYHDVQPLLDALVIAFAYSAFHELQSRDPVRFQAVCENDETLLDGQRDYLRWLVRRLEENDLLVKAESGWRLNDADAPPPADDIWRTLVADYPEMAPELLSIGRLGRHLPEIVAGREEPYRLLEAIRHSHQLDAQYDHGLTYQSINLAIQEVVRSLGDAWPAQRSLRILEISSGSSELSRRLLPLLPGDRVEYVIAAPESERLDHIEAEYASHRCVSVAEIVSESMELKQRGSELPPRYDVVIVHHRLHLARNLATALAGLKRHLVPGGVLALAERHADISSDFVFGADPGWWHASEEGNAVSSLMATAEWGSVLTRGGFEHIESLVEPGAGERACGSFMVLARNGAAQPVPAELPSARWVLYTDEIVPADGLVRRLMVQLEAHGQAVLLANTAEYPPADPQAQRSLLEHAEAALGGIDHVVHLAGLVDEIETGAVDPDRVESARCIGTLHLVQALQGRSQGNPRLWLVTNGGALVTSPPADWHINPLQAALWGLGRVIMNEQPGLGCTLVDVAMDQMHPEASRRLCNELLCPDGESEIVLAPLGRYGLRLDREQPAVEAAGESERFRLDFRVPGRLRNLVWLPGQERTLGAGEIEVQPAAVGLNFRDVMYAMGLLPDEAVENGFSGASLGLEFAGTVSRIGPGVTDYQIGDGVMGFGPACFSSHVVTTADAVTRKPADWSFAQAVTVPTVFFTVYYALKHLADLRAGERVLIHGAAGGVGIAAIQLARHLGAEIYATAGSEEKRDFVRLLGADRVFDSRSLAFADDILALTNGDGVDVVLNSLAGEAINRNLRVLKPFGRFLELGKRDFYENTHIGLRPFKDNISYFGIDADQLLVARPQLAKRLFREVMALFGEGVLAPLPYKPFPASQVVEAFRTMQQSRQIGKVVVEIDPSGVAVSRPQTAAQTLHLDGDSTWLVTGGLTGFGLAAARRLAERGAGHLVLLGRRGMDTPGAPEVMAEIDALGTQVQVFPCDVADSQSLAGILARIENELPPLKGILHAAMVLDDGLLQSLDAERFHRALAPKVLGAWNLHHQTLHLPLEYFVLFSSITTALGNPGQGNYVAANGYLESLAAMRRARGLPASCIGWGPIGDVGYLARNAEIKDSLAARLGAEPLSAAQALDVLERCLSGGCEPFFVADFDTPALVSLMPSAAGPRFAILRRTAARRDAGIEAGVDIRVLLAGKSPEEAQQAVLELVTGEVAQILCIATERIDPARSLYDLGMDSLMAVELALGIEKRFGISLPAMALSETPTAERISVRILDQLQGGAAATSDGIDNVVRMMASQHAEGLSAQEVDQTIDDVRREASRSARLIP